MIAAFAEPLVRLTAPGLSGQEVAAAVPMLRILAISVPLTISAEVMRALLNSRYSFGAPAAMTAVRSAVAAAVVLAAGGHEIETVAWAFVIGAIGQLLFLAAPWRSGSASGREPGPVCAPRRSRRPAGSACDPWRGRR